MGGGGKRFWAAEPMSALRRSGFGPSDGPSYGRYYGPGGGDVPVHLPPPMYPPLRPEPSQPPISWRVRGGGPETTWPAEGGGGDGYYSSGSAWPEPGRAGGGHQVSFAPFVLGTRWGGSLVGEGDGRWGFVALGFVMARVSFLFSFHGCVGSVSKVWKEPRPGARAGEMLCSFILHFCFGRCVCVLPLKGRGKGAALTSKLKLWQFVLRGQGGCSPSCRPATPPAGKEPD